MAQQWPYGGGILVIPGASWEHPIVKEVPVEVREAVFQMESMVLTPLSNQLQETLPEQYTAWLKNSGRVEDAVEILGWENIYFDDDANAKFWVVADAWCELDTKQKESFAKYYSYLVGEIEQAVQMRAEELADDIEFDVVWTCGGGSDFPLGTTYEEVMARVEASGYQRDPFFLQAAAMMSNKPVDQMTDEEFLKFMEIPMTPEDEKAQASILANPPLKKAEQVTVFLDDDDEEDTAPGIAPASPFDGMPAFPPGMFPSVTTDGLAKKDVCYCCGTKRNILRYYRAADDHVITCVVCLYDHLGQELQSDGTLTPVPSRNP